MNARILFFRAFVWPASILLASAVGTLGIAETVNLPLTDDTYTNQDRPDTNYGGAKGIYANVGGPKYAFVRFDVAPLSGKTSEHVESAILKFEVNELWVSGAIQVRTNDSGWDEFGTTWNNQPGSSSVPTTADVTVNSVGAYQVDVTDVVKQWADSPFEAYGFQFHAAPGNFKLWSKEGRANRAASLTVEVGDAPPLSDCGANVALGKTVAASGAFFELGWGDGYEVDYSAVTDGVFMKPGQRWDRGAVWWQESADNVKNALIVYLGNVERVTKIILQSDTNELYKVSWEDVRSGYQSVVVTPIHAPGLSFPTPVRIDAKTDAFRIEHDSGGDDYFSVSEFQACIGEMLTAVVIKDPFGRGDPVPRLYVPGPTNIIRSSLELDGVPPAMTRLRDEYEDGVPDVFSQWSVMGSLPAQPGENTLAAKGNGCSWASL